MKTILKKTALALGLATAFVSAPSISAKALSLEEASRKASNPLSDVWMLVTQNDASLMEGDLTGGKDRTQNAFSLQPIMPIPLGSVNFILRPIIPLAVTTPMDLTGKGLGKRFGTGHTTAESDSTTGVGDITVMGWFTDANPSSQLLWGAGFDFQIPSATDDALGSGEWSVGPSIIVVRMGTKAWGDPTSIDNWNIGFLANQFWGSEPDSDKLGGDVSYQGKKFSSGDSINKTAIQYFLNFHVSPTGLLGMTPVVNIDWQQDGSDRFSIPIGLGYIGVVKVGKLPMRWGVELQRYVTHPDAYAPHWNLKTFVAPIIANPMK